MFLSTWRSAMGQELTQPAKELLKGWWHPKAEQPRLEDIELLPIQAEIGWNLAETKERIQKTARSLDFDHHGRKMEEKLNSNVVASLQDSPP